MFIVSLLGMALSNCITSNYKHELSIIRSNTFYHMF